MILRAFCETSNVLQIFYFINMIVKILCYVVPAILILMLTIDIFKNVMSGEDNVIKNNMKMIIKRTIFAVAIFFVPMIVNISFGLLGDMNVSAAKCYNNANLSTIQSLKEKEAKEYEEYKAHKKAETEEKIKQEQQEQQDMIKENASSSGGSSEGARSSVDSNASWSEKIAQSAEVLAWPFGTSASIYKDNYPRNKNFTSWSQLGTARPTKAFMNAYDKLRPDHFKWGKSGSASKYGTGPRIGASCDVFVGTSVRYSGYDKKMPFGLSAQIKHLKSSSKWKKVSSAKRGDVCIKSSHVMIYLGNGKVAQAGLNRIFGVVQKRTCSGFNVYRVVN